jgi:hypothetical protein
LAINDENVMKKKTSEDDFANRVAEVVKAKRKRKVRTYPACAFEEAVEFAKSILQFGSGQQVRRLSLFDELGKSPDSGASRQLIVNSNKYGLTEGGYTAEYIKLTADGIKAVDEEISPREQTKARAHLSIESIEPFQKLYEHFKGNKLPAKTVLVDAAVESGLEKDSAEEAVDTFILNLRFVGLLQMLSGAERIVTVEHLLDGLPSSSTQILRTSDPVGGASRGGLPLVTAEQAKFETICFYVTPIGEDGSEHRKHSDLFLSSIVEPALEQFQLKVVRADAIDKPGTITRQIIEYLIKSRLVIVDLSFHNPNVFYELAIRHAARLPVVQIIRAADRIPFDLSQSRTIKIDTTDIYSLVPRLEVYKSEIASQVRRALDDPDSVDNPISVFYPSFKTTL